MSAWTALATEIRELAYTHSDENIETNMVLRFPVYISLLRYLFFYITHITELSGVYSGQFDSYYMIHYHHHKMFIPSHRYSRTKDWILTSISTKLFFYYNSWCFFLQIFILYDYFHQQLRMMNQPFSKALSISQCSLSERLSYLFGLKSWSCWRSNLRSSLSFGTITVDDSALVKMKSESSFSAVQLLPNN